MVLIARAWTYAAAAAILALMFTAPAHTAAAARSAWMAGPAAPSDVAASDLGGGVAQVTWVDNAVDEEGFDVQRESQKGNGDWFKTTIVATVGANVTSIEDEAGTGAYRYRVRSFNASGESVWSDWAEVVLADGGGDGGGDPVELTWTAGVPVNSYDWYYAEAMAAAHEEQGFDDWRLPTIEELQAGIADGSIGAFNANGSLGLYSSKKVGQWVWRVTVVADENGIPIPELSGEAYRLPIGSTYLDAKFVRP